MPLPPIEKPVKPMVRLLGGLLAFCAASTLSGPSVAAGWELEQGVPTPSYAVTEPASSDVNIDTVVLACEQGPHRRGLQLRLYLADAGPLAPRSPGALKADPSVTLAVDGVSHAAELLFADDSVLVADSADGAMPLLSETLLDALEQGRRMELRFDLVAEEKGQGPSFDGTAVVELQAKAVAAVRRCADEPSAQIAERPRSR